MHAAKTNGNASEQAISELIEFVQANSPYYAHTWRDIKGDGISLSDIPVVDHASFWESNTCRNSKVVTSQQTDGIIFKTGGTTAHPKVSFYSHGELENVSRQLADGLFRCGVQAGDLVANLFYAGDLYGSFLLHILSVYHLSPGAVQVPIAGHVSLESMEAHIVEFEATVVLATVTTMSKLAERILNAGKTHPYVRLLLFSGEAFYADQTGLLREAFPNATVKSLIYGSMDCGVIGLPPGPDVSENHNNDPRLHQVNSPSILVEILDDDGHVVTSPGEAGRLIVTNVERRLMPIVRYPSGDRAAWVDASRGLFRILDRDRTAIRLGPVSIDLVDLRRVVTTATAGLPVGALQAVVSREERRDKLTLAIAYTPMSEEQGLALQDAIREGLDASRPMFKEHVGKGLIGSLGVRFVSMGELVANPRSGKAVEVLDIRSTNV
ncbi:AMP-dependent synthetase/ligase [Apiospora arundinis]